MSKTFDETRRQQFQDFLDGITTKFDLHAVDPDEAADWAIVNYHGIIVDSAGGMCPSRPRARSTRSLLTDPWWRCAGTTDPAADRSASAWP